MDPQKNRGPYRRTAHVLFLHFGVNSGDEYDDREREESLEGVRVLVLTLWWEISKRLNSLYFYTFLSTHVTSCELYLVEFKAD